VYVYPNGVTNDDEETPDILKLVDKEIIGVLQQKLVKLLVIKLQNSYSQPNLTMHLILLIKNLLKCSPPESPIATQLRYRSLDEIVFEMLLNARSRQLKNLTEHNVF